VQIHRQHAVDPCRLQHVRRHLRADRHARERRSPVLARVPVIRDRRRDAGRRGALQRIHHQQHFHQAVVRRRAGRLEHETVLAAHVLQKLDHDLAVGELPTVAWPSGMFNLRTTACASSGFAFPVKTIRLS